MKVVLFCGGLGTRIRSHSDTVPKPMVNIGHRPILWHLMKYYAHFGHTDFILCLGYQSQVIKEYFLNYREWLSNDFVLSGGGKDVQLLNRDIDNWKITFVDTGVTSNIGQRLKAVEHHLDGEDVFMANYSDGLTDLWLPDYLDSFTRQGAVGSFLAVHSSQSFHVASVDDEGVVSGIQPLSDSEMWINGGFFVFRREIFDYIGEGEELVYEPFHRLIERRQLTAFKHRGFWMAMDTLKEKQVLEDWYALGQAPWEVWKQPVPAAPTPGVGGG